MAFDSSRAAPSTADVGLEPVVGTEIAPRQEIVVAEDNGAVGGFAAVDVSARVLTQIFVEPHRKRQGVGRQLLARAQQLMPDGFCLWTLEGNVASRTFYERHGLSAGRRQINPVNGMSTIEYCWAPRPADEVGRTP